ncbi:MAG: type I-U CRISPR-associated protein Csx17 [Desertifilum sp.]|nr:type I-U CRISPR-associated protein Csx17 [Desertifilum sp.]
MPILALRGCTPEPLSHYLKALGVLRLVVEQRDSQTLGYWKDECFWLETQGSETELVQFFLETYKPTPLIAPWNGSTGFYAKDKAQHKLLEAFIDSPLDRFKEYGKTIAIAIAEVNALQLQAQPQNEEKRYLLERLRNSLPDEAVQWLDTCALITAETLNFPPLAGTGGNDGNFEFSRTYMQQIQELFDLETGKAGESAELMLRAALLGDAVPGLQFSGKIGQFNPIAAGGANAAPGYDGPSRVNPWDFILMLEGMMLFAASSTRRYEQSEGGTLAYPFTVRPSRGGYGSASEQDTTRAELWVPLWSRPAGLGELQLLFSEGRAKVGTRSAKNGIDFARALSTQGVNRGIDQFIRYSFQERNGLSYFAIPLGRFQPKFRPQVGYLTELDSWLARFEQAAQDSNAPATVARSHRQLTDVLMDWNRDKATLLDVLVALGNVEAVLARSLKFTQSKYLPPIPQLESRWLWDCRQIENSLEFRLALSLAGENLRPRLVPVRGEGNKLIWTDNEDGVTIWQASSLTRNLVNWLRREEIEAQKRENSEKKEKNPTEPPKRPPLARLADVAAWIENDDPMMDARIEAIARGLSLVEIPTKRPRKPKEIPLPPQKTSKYQPKHPYVPLAYALVAIAHHRFLRATDVLKVFEKPILAEDKRIPRVPGMLARLASGDCWGATGLAARRLQASGLQPAITEGIFEKSDRAIRIAAALAFPISEFDTARLLKQVRQLTKDEYGFPPPEELKQIAD